MSLTISEQLKGINRNVGQELTQPIHRIINAGLLGNGSGVVGVPGKTGWVYARIHGIAAQLVQAWNYANVPLIEGLDVVLERFWQGGGGGYMVAGRAPISAGDDVWGHGYIGEHHLQHERWDANLGGYDSVDVQSRMISPLRAVEQETPNLTLRLTGGVSALTGNVIAEQNSPTFDPSAITGSDTRYDLLYLGTDDAYHILAGVAGASPTRPIATVSAVPICWVLLSTGQTTIQEASIYDAGAIRGAVVNVPSGHNILSVSHSDTLADAVLDGDTIIGNVTPKWSRLAISIPAANVRNVLGVDNAELRPSWKTALDSTAPADIAGTAAAGTSLVFSHRDHAHRGVVSVNKSGGATLYGAVTLSEGANITLTQVGQDVAIAAAGGGGAHNIFSATHSDTLADSVLDGDIPIGNVTPKLSRLAISVPAANVRNVLGIDNAELRPSWKTALDATVPTTIAESASAAAGTSLVFSHRDHTHGAPATWAATVHDLISTHSATVAAGKFVVATNTNVINWSTMTVPYTCAAGDLFYATNNNVVGPLAVNITDTKKYLQSVSYGISYEQVSLTAGVTGILPSANGGTGVNNAGTLTNATATTITGGGTLALGGFTLTCPATGTAAMLNQANSFTLINPLTTLAESWIGPSSTAGVYFKGGNVGFGTTVPAYPIDAVNSNGRLYYTSESLHIQRTVAGTPQDHYGYYAVRDSAGVRGAYFGWGSPGSYVDLSLGAGNNLAITGGNVVIGTTVAAGLLTLGSILAPGDGTTHLSGHDGFAGFRFWSYDGIDTTLRTIIADGTGDIKNLCLIFLNYCSSDTTTRVGTYGAMYPGQTTVLADADNDQWTITCNANGSLTIQRTQSAGSHTLKMAMWILWV
jgi:hypothetical protein